MRLALTVSFLALLTACGARTELDVASSDSGRPDAGRTQRDAGTPRDAGDAGGTSSECAADCDDGIFCNGAEGCDPSTLTCTPGTPPTCDDGEECTVDSCSAETDTCSHERVERDEDADGVGACEGDCDDRNPQRSPRVNETCDDLDNDCDGSVDEGVRSPCNDCRPGCNLLDLPGDDDWDLESDSAGLEVEDGRLELSSTRTETYFAWVANHLFATVTKIDTRDGSQSAEYDTALIDGSNDARPPGERCLTQESGGNCPSRTAVDLRGAVYVANRAFFNQGTVTKIAGLESDCIDRNANGRIDTSRDIDGDGIIERDVPGEFLGQQDECILWTVNVGSVGGVPRALAVDSTGTVWVGLHDAALALQLDPVDGSVLRSVALPRTSPFSGFRPYGAVSDGRGNVWFVESASGSIVSVNATTGAVGSIRTAATRADDCSSSYGVAVDSDDRIWVAGFLCEAAFRYDPDVDRWFEVPLPDSGVSRGIAADGEGRVYVASSHEWIRFLPSGSITASDPISRLTIFDADTGRDLRILGLDGTGLPGLGTTGVGLASDGAVWLVNQDSSTATRVDPTSGAARDFPTGVSPYTYSDFTGYALRTFTAPNGFLRTIVSGCAFGPTEWERVEWDADVPAGTRVELRARTAPSTAELRSATWVGPWTTRPTELALPPGPLGTETYLELELSLFTEETLSPSVRGVTLQYHCPI